METIIVIYLMKVSVALTLFYLLYRLCFAGDTFFRLRRFYFLFTIIFSLLFPFFTAKVPWSYNGRLPVYWLSEIAVGVDGANHPVDSPSLGITALLFIVFFAVSALMLLRFVYQMVIIALLKHRSQSRISGNYTFIELRDNDMSSFSFFKWIFIDPSKNDEEKREILIHEKLHADQFHTVDVLLAELLCVCLWWNPVVWLLKKEIKINLEYLADRGVLNEGFDPRIYQYLLLQKSTENTGITLINNFNVSQLKKRIIMMNKRKSSMAMSIKYLLTIPAGAILLLGNAVQASPALMDFYQDEVIEVKDVPQDVTVKEIREGDQKKGKGGVFITVDQMPKFPGGEEAMQRFIAENLKYPLDAQKKGIQGRVVIRFIVKSTGKVSDVTILRGIDPICDDEAVRVVNAMPNWVPGKQNGQLVDVYYTLPIVFRLKEENVAPANDTTKPTDNETVAIGYS